NTNHWQLQCSPIPLPALGTQRIIQGNGTNVGSIVSLQCPARHKLVGKDLMCVMGSNSTQWVGQTYCQPLSFYEDYGFRVAVLSSIISSGIILLLSVAFITCCLLNCIKEDSKKRFDSHSYKGRNNNNNNTQEKTLPSWDAAYPAQCENMRPCRCGKIFILNKGIKFYLKKVYVNILLPLPSQRPAAVQLLSSAVSCCFSWT
uniref:Sushi domain containing 3 n=1 Tax=Nothobranchius furzeri TaxID=105023 RepID=A0A8C6VZL1_NOTFU